VKKGSDIFDVLIAQGCRHPIHDGVLACTGTEGVQLLANVSGMLTGQYGIGLFGAVATIAVTDLTGPRLNATRFNAAFRVADIDAEQHKPQAR
jgi:hypothetical protein